MNGTRLLDAALAAGCDSLAVVGMAKNAGKTVTLNHLIDDAYHHGIVLGLTSIGRDGEALDLVTKTEKPTIYVYEHTLIATAESLFGAGTADLEILHMSDEHTAMGRLVLARVRREGFVQLAGPATTGGIAKVKAQLLRLGAKLVLVDGALDRTSLASPAVTSAAVLATGAVLSRDMAIVLAATAHKVALFAAPAIGEVLGHGASAAQAQAVVGAMHEAVARRSIGIINVNTIANAIANVNTSANDDPPLKASNTRWLELRTALGAGKKLASIVKEHGQEGEIICILLPGSLVASLVLDFVSVFGTLKNVIWLVQDATKVFIDARELLQLKKYGFKWAVLSEIKLLGVTVNPTAPAGYSFDGSEFLEAMRDRLLPAGLAVFDVYQEEAAWMF